MYFAIICVDKPGMSAVRSEVRPKHLEYIGRFKNRMVAAGPLQTDDGDAMLGSLLILDVADRRAAEAFAGDDPYARAGLFDSVVIRRWHKVMPAD